jgi:MFS family permease
MSTNQPGSDSNSRQSPTTTAEIDTPRSDGWGNFWIPKIWWSPAKDFGESVRRRVCVHLIPILFCLYIVAYLDRANLAWAQLDLEKNPEAGGLAFTSEIIGLGASMFFYGYWILEIPSTLSVLKRGARYVFIRILVLWGICATLNGFIGHPFATNYLFGWLPTLGGETIPIWKYAAIFINELPTNAAYQLYFFRFMLGVFEGGFFPTVIFFLSVWFRQKDRAKAIALFMAAIPISLAFGSELSKQLLKLEWFELQGWRWIFIIQGVLPIIAAVVTAFVLPNRPSEAMWLTPNERTWLQNEIDHEHHSKSAKHGFAAFKSQLGVVILLTLVYFGQNISSYGLSTFMPIFYSDFVKSADDRAIDEQLKPYKTQLADYAKELAAKKIDPKSAEYKTAMDAKKAELKPAMEPLEAQVTAYQKRNKPYLFALTTATYLIAFVGMLVNGWHSDRKQERLWHVCIPLITLGSFMFLAAAFYDTPSIALPILLFGVGFFHYAHLPAFWPIPTLFLGSAAAASAIGFINMIGNLGGSTGQTIVGIAGKESFQKGMFYIAPAPIVAGLIVLAIGLYKQGTSHSAKSD